jgi:predicted enzyme related to lactoylglutathione lyase
LNRERRSTVRLTPYPRNGYTTRLRGPKARRVLTRYNGPIMITAIHTIVYSRDADRVRAFFRDVLELPSVDAGHGWLIFAAPPAELAVHPDEKGGRHELYLMCDDVHATAEKMKCKGIEPTMPITDQGWGLLTRIRLPSGDEFGLYQPKHPTAYQK